MTEKSGLARTGWQTGVCVGDYDNDGWDDLFCCFWGHNILFHNNGDGTFTDVTRKAGVYDERVRWGAGCTFLDYDRDGHLDLFVCNYIKLDPGKDSGAADDARFASGRAFRRCAARAGLPATPTFSITTMATERSPTCRRRPEFSSRGRAIRSPRSRTISTTTAGRIFTSRWIREPSILFRNNHDGTFTDIAVMAGCAYSENGHEQAGMGVGVADYDCDGWFDIFKTNFADDTCNLYHNNGDGTFSDVTFASGIGINNQYVAWGCGFVDYDNDGWADIMQVNGHVYPEIDGHEIGQTFKNPRLVYRNLGNGRFKDVSAEMGPGITRAIFQPRRGVWRLRQRRRHGRADPEHERSAVAAAQRWRQQAELDQDQVDRDASAIAPRLARACAS